MRYTSAVLSPVLCIWKVCRPVSGAVKPLPHSVSETATVSELAGLGREMATTRPATTAGTATTATGSTQTGRRRGAGTGSRTSGAGDAAGLAFTPRTNRGITTAR